MQKTRTIESLNTLVNITNYTIEGYESILQRTNKQDLKILFAELALSGEKRKQKLISTIEKMSKPEKRRIKLGAGFLNMWKYAKAAVVKLNNQPQVKIIKYEKV
jgi:hypothetical protein